MKDDKDAVKKVCDSLEDSILRWFRRLYIISDVNKIGPYLTSF